MADPAAEEYYETVTIEEREFQVHSVENKIYCMPVDDVEEDRLISQYRALQMLLEDQLFFPPIAYPRRVLECGYGRGSWALAMAEMYPGCEITALDIFPAELADDQPDNLEFEVWNLNHSLIPTYRPGTYDLVHSRLVAPGIKKERWRSYVRDLARLLKRGGWVQLAEFYYIVQSDSGRLTDNHAMSQFDTAHRWCLEQTRDPRVGRNLTELLRQTGLVDIQQRTLRLPIGEWPADPTERAVGREMLEQISVAFQSHGIWPLTQQLHWSREQVVSLAQRAQAEAAADPTLKLYIPLTVAWARKA